MLFKKITYILLLVLASLLLNACGGSEPSTAQTEAVNTTSTTAQTEAVNTTSTEQSPTTSTTEAVITQSPEDVTSEEVEEAEEATPTAAPTITDPSDGVSKIQQIRARGELIAGVKYDFLPLYFSAGIHLLVSHYDLGVSGTALVMDVVGRLWFTIVISPNVF